MSVSTETLASMAEHIETLVKKVEALTVELESAKRESTVWRNDRRMFAGILATFYRSELSMSSVQPLLTLAEELCPELKSFEKRS